MSIFFKNLNLKIVKVYRIDEVILVEAAFVMALEVIYRGIKPYGARKVKVMAYPVDRVKNLVGSGIIFKVLNHHIPKYPVVPDKLGPDLHKLIQTLRKPDGKTPLTELKKCENRAFTSNICYNKFSDFSIFFCKDHFIELLS